jgi:hypothetical protein
MASKKVNRERILSNAAAKAKRVAAAEGQPKARIVVEGSSFEVFTQMKWDIVWNSVEVVHCKSALEAEFKASKQMVAFERQGWKVEWSRKA